MLLSWRADCFLQSWAARKPIAANSLTHCCVEAASPKTEANSPFPFRPSLPLRALSSVRGTAELVFHHSLPSNVRSDGVRSPPPPLWIRLRRRPALTDAGLAPARRV